MKNFEDVRVLGAAEAIADAIWDVVNGWQPFARDVVGGQLVRAADSIGANIAESLGRYNFGEKLQFLYYARGSLFETKYWLNRSLKRKLITPEQATPLIQQLAGLARQLNSFATGLRAVKRSNGQGSKTVQDGQVAYTVDSPYSTPNDPVADDVVLFDDTQLQWLASLSPSAASPSHPRP